MAVPPPRPGASCIRIADLCRPNCIFMLRPQVAAHMISAIQVFQQPLMESIESQVKVRKLNTL